MAYRGLPPTPYAWDLIDDGVATVAGRARDAGLDTVTLAASYHAGKFLRPHGRSGKVYFPVDGTVYFAAAAGALRHRQADRQPAGRRGRRSLRRAGQGRAGPRPGRLDRQGPVHNTVAWGDGIPTLPSRPQLSSATAMSISLVARPIRRQRDYVVALCADLADPRTTLGGAGRW